jgi:TonB family protein
MKKILIVLVAAAAACAGGSAEPVEKPELMPAGSPFAYPVALWDQGAEGETVLMVHVTELGVVDSAYVYGTSGFAEFDSVAVTGAKALRFAPAKQGDRRIPQWTKVHVPFTRDSVAAKAANSAGAPRAGGGS